MLRPMSYRYTMDEACFIVPKMAPRSNVLAMLQPFRPWAWFGMAASGAGILIFYLFYTKINPLKYHLHVYTTYTYTM